MKWLLDAVPSTAKNMKLAERTANNSFEFGRGEPFQLEDRAEFNKARSYPPPPASQADYRNGTARPRPHADNGEAAEDGPPPGISDPGYQAAQDTVAVPGDDRVTEGTVADGFARAHHDQLRYCHHTGKWFIWDGTRWKREETKLAYRWAHQQAKAMAAGSKAVITAGKGRFRSRGRATCAIRPGLRRDKRDMGLGPVATRHA